MTRQFCKPILILCQPCIIAANLLARSDLNRIEQIRKPSVLLSALLPPIMFTFCMTLALITLCII